MTQAFGTVFSLWPAMTRCYADLHALLADCRGPGVEIAARFAGHFESLTNRSFLATESWRAHREAVYDDMHARCVAAVVGKPPARPLSAQLTPDGIPPAPPCLVAAIADRLDDAALAQQLADTIMAFLARGQRIVAAAEAIQADIARLLHRAAPAHRLTLAQLNLHNVLMGEEIRTVPFLPAEIAALFGITIDVDAATIAIRLRPAAASRHSPETHAGEYSALVH